MKTRLITLLATLGATSALCAACDTGGDSGSTPASPTVELDAIAQQLDAVVCQLAFECECTFGRRFDSAAECSTWAQEQQATAERLTDQYNLTWDPTCVGWFLRAYEQAGCGSNAALEADPDGDGCFGDCMPLHGDRNVGQSCTSFDNGLSDCGQGLRCNGQTCVERCPEPAAEGEDCRDRNCAAGLSCEFGDDVARCVAAPGDGESCGGAECGEGLRCVLQDPTNPTDPDPRCTALAAVAEACMGHAECESGYCPAGFCERVPERGGDCRGTQICAEGLACIDDVCGDPLERGDACKTSCGGGLDCIDGLCVGANAAACYPGRPISG